MTLDLVLNECLEALRAGTSVEECLARNRDKARKLEPLLRVAARLWVAEPLALSPAAYAEGRRKLGEAVEAKAAAIGKRAGLAESLKLRLQTWFRPPDIRPLPWLGMAFEALLIVALVGGVVVAMSAGSLPGQSLYPVKRAVESISMALTPDAASQARLHMTLAERRLAEVETLLRQQGRLDEVALAEWSAELRAALAAIERVAGLETVQEVLALFDLRVGEQQAILERLLAQTDGETHESLLVAFKTAAAYRQLAADAIGQRERLEPTPGGTPLPARTPEPGRAPMSTPVRAVIATSTPGASPTRTPPQATHMPGESPSPMAPSEPIIGDETRRPTETPAPPGPTLPPWLPTKTSQPHPTEVPPSPEPTEAPEPTRTPEPTEEPKPTRVPEPTEAPKPTRTPEPTEAPKPTRTPEPTEAPEPTRTPEPTEAPEPTRVPEPTEEPEPTHAPEPTEPGA